MLKSWSDDEEKSAREWDAVETPEHVGSIWEAIEGSFPRYFCSLVKPIAPKGHDLMEMLASSGKFKVASSNKKKPATPDIRADGSVFDRAIAEYEKKALKYRDFFSCENLTEYRDDDPDGFKDALSRKCPIILTTLQSKNIELKDWMIKYRQTRSDELLSTFENLSLFANEYISAQSDEVAYATFETSHDFGLDGFTDERAGILGVIGGGIKSTILYHLDSRLFPLRSSKALYALYFLTGKQSFDMPSKTSEFLMINDRLLGRDINIKMGHNNWYPYRLFTVLAHRLARTIQAECHACGLPAEVEHRYVFVDAFLQHVVETHKSEMKDLRGVDDLQFWTAK